MYPWGGKTDRVASISTHPHRFTEQFTPALHFCVASKLLTTTAFMHQKWLLLLVYEPSIDSNLYYIARGMMATISYIYYLKIKCFFLQRNPLHFIDFCWSVKYTFCTHLSRKGPLTYETCVDHILRERSFSSWMFPRCPRRCAYGRMYMWSGFDVDSRWGTFCMAGKSLQAMLLPRSSVRRHTGRTRTYRCILYTRGVSEFKAEEWQYFIRQEAVACKKQIFQVVLSQQHLATQTWTQQADLLCWNCIKHGYV